MPVTHTKVSAIPDSTDVTLIQPSDWNASHTIDIFVDGEVPTGTINSTDGSDGNGTFTLSVAPSPAASLRLYRNGILLRPAAVDFTLTTLTITFTIGQYPITGDSLVAFYRKA